MIAARFAVCLIVGLAGCDLGAPYETVPRTDVVQGRALFERNCANCHGADAKGDGSVSRSLGIAPPDLTQLAKQNSGVFPRNRVMSAIDGFNRQTHWANPMPLFGDEGLGPVVQVEEDGISTPVPADLLALAAYLESIQN